MRRLAKQDRQDKYASMRDYQAISTDISTRVLIEAGSSYFVADTLLEGDDPSGTSGFGCFVRPKTPTTVDVTIETTDGETKFSRALNGSWTRMGVAFSTPDDGEVRLTMSFEPTPEYVDIWGFSLSEVDVNSFVDPDKDTLTQLNQDHLVPETLFLEHTARTEAALSNCSTFDDDGEEINLKKCSYCGRLLPLDPLRQLLSKLAKAMDGPNTKLNDLDRQVISEWMWKTYPKAGTRNRYNNTFSSVINTWNRERILSASHSLKEGKRTIETARPMK